MKKNIFVIKRENHRKKGGKRRGRPKRSDSESHMNGRRRAER